MLLLIGWLIHSDMMRLVCHDQRRAKKFHQPENSIFFSGAGMKSSGVEKKCLNLGLAKKAIRWSVLGFKMVVSDE